MTEPTHPQPSGDELPPPTGPPVYGTGPVPVEPPPSVGTQVASIWEQPPPSPPPPPAGPPPFWPSSGRWMGFDPERPPRWGLPDVVLGLVSFLVGTFLVGGSVLVVGAASTGLDAQEFARTHAGLISITSLAGSWIATVAFLHLVVRFKGLGSLAKDFGLRFTAWDPLIGAGAALFTLMATVVLQAIVALIWDTEPPNNADAIFGAVDDNPLLLAAMILMASIGAPLVEELLFRGLALRAIEKRFGGVAAVIGSAALFGLLHFQPDTPAPATLVAGIALYGFVFAVLTRWSGRLGPAVCTHVCLNALASLVMLVGQP
jgi:membrane protease YdiL (CAAX protease family)